MGTIQAVWKMTNNRFLNLYQIEATSVHGAPVHYFLASRCEDVEKLKLKTRRNDPDGVAIYALYGPKRDRVVLIRQYRYTIGDYIYEFPAGLVEPDEDYHQAAIRELKEETGLDLEPLEVEDIFQKPYFTTIGLTDESCGTVYGYASGSITSQGEEDTEEIEVVLADRAEVRRILKEERVAIMCAYMLLHFLADEEPFRFLEKTKK